MLRLADIHGGLLHFSEGKGKGMDGVGRGEVGERDWEKRWEGGETDQSEKY